MSCAAQPLGCSTPQWCFEVVVFLLGCGSSSVTCRGCLITRSLMSHAFRGLLGGADREHESKDDSEVIEMASKIDEKMKKWQSKGSESALVKVHDSI